MADAAGLGTGGPWITAGGGAYLSRSAGASTEAGGLRTRSGARRRRQRARRAGRRAGRREGGGRGRGRRRRKEGIGGKSEGGSWRGSSAAVADALTRFSDATQLSLPLVVLDVEPDVLHPLASGALLLPPLCCCAPGSASLYATPRLGGSTYSPYLAMNVPHDMLRSNMHQSLMAGQPFIQPQSQQAQHQPQHNLAMLQNPQGANGGLGFMANQPGASNANYPLNMQAAAQSRPPFMRGHTNGPGAGPSHMGALPNQMPNMTGFPSGPMMQQPGLRRVQSQPLNQGGAHMQGMQSSMMSNGMVLNGPPQMVGIRAGMNGVGAGMTQPMQMQIRQQPQQQQQPPMQGGGLPRDMSMMNQSGHLSGGNPLPTHGRTGSGPPIMSGMTQQTGHPQSHPMQQSMQSSMQHGAFGTSMPLQHQHQQGQMGSSPHAPPSQQQPTMNGPMTGNPMLQQGAVNRTPDNAMFNFAGTQMQSAMPHGVPRMGMPNMSNPQFAITPSTTPLNSGQDMPPRGNPQMNASGPPPQGLMTPAQLRDHMNPGGENFAGPAFAPNRPPSHPIPHNTFPMSQPQSSLPPPQQSPRQPNHPPTPMQAGPALLQRPQSASRHSPIPPPNRTPRVSQSSLPPGNTGAMLPPRVPTAGPGQTPSGPAHPVQPSASAPPVPHAAQIPRPPTATSAQPTAPPPTGAPAAPPSVAPPATQPVSASERPPPALPAGSAPAPASGAEATPAAKGTT